MEEKASSCKEPIPVVKECETITGHKRKEFLTSHFVKVKKSFKHFKDSERFVTKELGINQSTLYLKLNFQSFGEVFEAEEIIIITTFLQKLIQNN